MKKFMAGVIVLAFVLVPFAASAAQGYYNLGLMETAQMLKQGHFMISAASDSGFYRNSNQSRMIEEASGEITYIIIEGLEADIGYNHSIYMNFDTKNSTSAVGNLKLRMKYAFGLGDVLRLSLGLGVGFPLAGDSSEFESLTDIGQGSIIPAVCLSANLGGVGLHVQLKDIIYPSDDTIAWLQARAAIVFDFKDLLLSLGGGIDNISSESQLNFMGGPELVWNVAGPLQLNFGVYGEKWFDLFFIRGVVKATLAF
jgi:hypothetical protein